MYTSPSLSETIPAAARPQLPTFVFGNILEGRLDQDLVLEGNANLRRGDTSLRAHRIEYDQSQDQLKATGDVRIQRAGDRYRGRELELQVDAFVGHFLEPEFFFLRNGAMGSAQRLDFLGDKHAIAHQAQYTSCRRSPMDGLLDWVLKADRLELDTEANVGQAQGGQLRFMDVPILPIPASMSFPLTDERKSGLLPPTIGLDNINGLEWTQPYYLNLAPNRDLTLSPTLMSKRGAQLASEFRYLEPDYRGQLRADVMPNDPLRQQRDRWGLAGQHQGLWYTGLDSIGPLSLSLNVNRVSDDDYWRDFNRISPATLNQRLLPTDLNLGWARGDWFVGLRTLKWQTLQDITTPITPPYDRLPQLTTRYSQLYKGAFDWLVETDLTRFQSTPGMTLQPNATRAVARAEISLPLRNASGFVVPKMQWHASQYQFDSPLASGSRSATRQVPTFSLDSGLVFERDADYFGRAYQQTLEPRAFYTYTPFRDQNYLPNYDSGLLDFNFATIYTENPYIGNDRIADNNLLTLGLNSRLLHPQTGAEAARFGLAQRFRFRNQDVVLPGGTPVTDRFSDILAGASLNLDNQWAVNSTVQYNPNTHLSERITLGGRFHPSNYRVLNVAYRLQRNLSEQLDLGWQWPLNDLWGDAGTDLGPGRGLGPGADGGRWYSVGRLNFSLQDRRLVDSILGLEYDAGCWLGRVVFERLQTSLATASQRVMFQLEFVGFSRLGSNPLRTLKDNIPRYQYLREPGAAAPSRFTDYD